MDKEYTIKTEIFSEEYKPNGTMYTLNNIIGNSPAIKLLKKKIYKIADSSSSVLIYGETGTGKELIVQAMHNASFKRRKKPFVAQNCAAIPNNLLESILFGTSEGSFTGSKEKKGLFELANGGTLLLDEINSMDIELQAKLLRVLQTGVVRPIGSSKTINTNVRIVATSNIDPYIAVKNGQIRSDLFYRLNVIDLVIPALRDRKEDLLDLCNYYIAYYNKNFDRNVTGITNPAFGKILAYNWPGNIRELKYIIENIMNFIESHEIEIENLPDKIAKFESHEIEMQNGKITKEHIVESKLGDKSLKEILEETERELIIEALGVTNGNKAEAARLLKIPRQTLQNKVKKLDIRINFSVE